MTNHNESQQVSSTHVTAYVATHSYEATRIRKELADVERALAYLQKKFKLTPQPTDPVHLVVGGSLVDPLEAGAGATLAATLSPESPQGVLITPVLRILLPRIIGGGAVHTPLLIDGLIAYALGGLKLGPSLSATNEALAPDATNHSLPSLRSVMKEVDNLALGHSFVGYLLKQHSPAAIITLITEFDPERMDHSAMAAFQSTWAALEADWAAQLRRKKTSTSTFGELWRYVGPKYGPYWFRQIEVFLYMIIGLIAGLAFPIGSKYVLDTVIPQADSQLLLLVVAGLLLFQIVNALVGMRRAYVSSWINGQVANALQSEMFVHLQNLSHGFYSRARVGDLLTRLSSDVQTIQSALSQVLGTGIFLLLRIIVAAATMLILEPIMALIIIVAIPLFSVIYFMLRGRLQQASLALRSLYGDVASITQESLSAHALIKAFSLIPRISGRYKARLDSLLNAQLNLVTMGALFETSVGIASSIGNLLILGVGGYLVITGQTTIGTLVAIIGLLPSIFQPIAGLASLGQTIEQASGSLQRYQELLETPVDITDSDNPTTELTLQEGITFDDVVFAYEPDHPVLRSLSLRIEAGKHVAIVGPSGSGKSTLINLLLRFWDPDEGRVMIDGHDLRDISLDTLRGMIGIVFQDTFVFDSTLRENILIGNPNATDKEVRAAASAARLDEYIESLPDGIDTLLGERGVRMSGGQRQRLAIARVILRNPQLLLLDEATSALDAKTERAILTTFLEVARERTTISITHRLSLAEAADWIVVVQDGRVAEQGTHESLIAEQGVYYSLHQEQYGHPTQRVLESEELAALRSVALFQQLPDSTLATIASNMLTEYHAPDTTIVRQGDPSDTFYYIKEGRVAVLVEDYTNQQREVTTLSANDYFGEMGIIGDVPRNATIRTITPAVVYAITQADFRALLDQQPDLYREILKTSELRAEALLEAGPGQ